MHSRLLAPQNAELSERSRENEVFFCVSSRFYYQGKNVLLIIGTSQR